MYLQIRFLRLFCHHLDIRTPVSQGLHEDVIDLVHGDINLGKLPDGSKFTICIGGFLGVVLAAQDVLN